MKDQEQSINKRIKETAVILGGSSSFSSYVFAFTATAWIHARIAAALTDKLCPVFWQWRKKCQRSVLLSRSLQLPTTDCAGTGGGTDAKQGQPGLQTCPLQ